MSKVFAAMFFVAFVIAGSVMFFLWKPGNEDTKQGILNVDQQGVGKVVNGITGNSIGDISNYCQDDAGCGPSQVCVNRSCVVKPR